jgi:hypothetical protein
MVTWDSYSGVTEDTGEILPLQTRNTESKSGTAGCEVC